MQKRWQAGPAACQARSENSVGYMDPGTWPGFFVGKDMQVSG